MALPHKQRDEYTVAWICPLQKELTAALEMLDEEHESLPNEFRDNSVYQYGSIGGHNVVVASLPSKKMGEGAAATVAKEIWRSFPSLRFALLVGIGGGVPSADVDIHLGDVVISEPEGTTGGVIQYDFGKRTANGGFERRGALNEPPTSLLNAITFLGTRIERKRSSLASNLSRALEGYQYPNAEVDNLYTSDYVHEAGSTCSQCDPAHIISRPPRGTIPKVHRGVIASGNSVMKDGLERDRVSFSLAKQISSSLEGILCFDMEAAGLMNNLPCLVIRGISDYSDSHKNDGWQKYAAATAAACAKEILQIVPPQETHGMPRMADLMGRLNEIDEANERREKEAEARRKEKEAQKQQRKIMDWLVSSDDFNIIKQLPRDVFGEGSWFQEREAVEFWQSVNESVELRCFGEPGVGKTVLSHQMKLQISKRSPSSHPLVLSLFLDYNHLTMFTVEQCLRRLLRQIASSSSKHIISDAVREQYDEYARTGEQPSVTVLERLLVHELNNFKEAYIIVDGLEEIFEDDAVRLCTALSNIRDQCSLAKIRLAIFSRAKADEVGVDEGVFCDDCEEQCSALYWSCERTSQEERHDLCRRCYREGAKCPDLHSMRLATTLQKVDPDPTVIHEFVQYQLKTMSTHRPSLATQCKKHPELSARVCDAVAARANGSFLVASRCMDSLKNKSNYADILDALESLPRNLRDIYQQLVNRIKRLDDDERSLAERALTWITMADRKLSVQELGQALALRAQDKSFNEDRVPDGKDIVASTQGLVTVEYDRQSQESKYSLHLTLRQFLKSQDTAKWFRDRQREMVRDMIKFLNFDDVSGSSSTSKFHVPLELRFQKHPLYRYAIRYWPEHVRPYQNDEEVKEALTEFLSDSGKVSYWIQAVSEVKNEDFQDLFREEGALTLHICAGYGFHSVLRNLPDVKQNIDSVDPFYHRTSLVYACREGQTETAKTLLDLGASVSVEDYDGFTALLAAILRSDSEIVAEILKRKDVDVNKRLPHEHDQTPLMLAVSSTGKMARHKATELDLETLFQHNERILGSLLKHKDIQVNLSDAWGRSALNLAVISGSDKMADMLVRHPKIDLDQADTHGDPPLINAASCGRLSCVEMLLNQDVDPNTRDTPGGGNFLQRAIDEGHLHIVQKIYESNFVDCFHVRDNQNRTLLHSACVNQRENIIPVLLKARLDVNAQGTGGETPLHDACRVGSLYVAQSLLEAGAQTQVRDRHERSPKDVAWQNGYTYMLPLFENIEAKGDIDGAVETLVGEAKSLAVSSEQSNGDQKCGEYPNAESLPTWSLAKLGLLDVLKNRAKTGKTLSDIDPDTGNSAVHWAASTREDQVEVLKILLENDLPVDNKNMSGMTPLHLTAYYGSAKYVKLLLQKNVPLHKQDIFGQTALSVALNGRRMDVALELILADAVTPDLKQDLKQDALIIAVAKHCTTAVRNLCEKGASPWIPDEGGFSPRMIAKINNDDETFKVLDSFKDPRGFTIHQTSAALSSAPGGTILSSVQSYLQWSMASARKNLPH